MRPILVLGLPRGGTTWLGQTLASTPRATYVHEPDGVHEPFAYRARVRDGVTQYPAFDADTAAPEHERLWRGAFAGGARPTSLRARVAEWAYGVPPEIKRDARSSGRYPARLRVAMAAATPLQPRVDVDTIVVKSVNAALSAEWLSAHFAPKVVIATRDIRNVVASWKAIGLGAPGRVAHEHIRRAAAQRWQLELPEWGTPIERTITLCATLLLALQDALRMHPDWIWVAHEACIADPGETLRTTAAALELEWSSDAQAFVESSNRPGTGYATNRVAEQLVDQWKSRLDADDLAVFDTVLGRFPARLQSIAFAGSAPRIAGAVGDMPLQ